jgi:uncharacterized protein YbjQ (UPF0145 family)
LVFSPLTKSKKSAPFNRLATLEPFGGPSPKSSVPPSAHTPVQERVNAQIRVVKPARPSREDAVLVTTTQTIEGKTIRNYQGLIHASHVVRIDLFLISEKEGLGAEYERHLHEGGVQLLQRLREEASLAGANAVLAASFNFQKLDPQLLLLSAIGTAVWVE